MDRRLEQASGWWQEQIFGVENEAADVNQGPHSHDSACLETLLCGSLFSRVWAGVCGLDSSLPNCEEWPLPQVTDGTPPPNPKEPQKPRSRGRF